MSLAAILRRLDALDAAIANSFAARLKSLTPKDRAIYDEWRTMRERWARQFFSFEPEAAYIASLNGNYGPQLPDAIERQLFATVPQITNKDSLAQAAEKYRRCLEYL